MNFWSKVQLPVRSESECKTSGWRVPAPYPRPEEPKHKQKPAVVVHVIPASYRNTALLLVSRAEKWPPAKKVALRQQTELLRLETP